MHVDRVRRRCCRAHAEGRIAERRFPRPLSDVEAYCWRMRRCFMQDGQTRYTLRVSFGRGRTWWVVWDSALRCVVTVYPVKRGA